MKKYPFNFNDVRLKLEVDSKNVKIKCKNKDNNKDDEFDIEFS